MKDTKKYTKMDIERLAKEVIEFLRDNDFIVDTSVYYNNKRWSRKLNDDMKLVEMVEENINPTDYFNVSEKHILSMSFEGDFYNYINCGNSEEFSKLLEKYDLYFEQYNAWNLTCYPDCGDIEDWEYTDYEIPKKQEVIRLRYGYNIDDAELDKVANLWYALVKIYGTNGSCVLGDGFKFTYKDQNYFLSTNYIQSDSVNEVLDGVRNALVKIGATEISYNCGHLD